MKHYCLKCGAELDEGTLICPHCHSCSYIDIMTQGANSVSSVLSAQQIEFNTQWLKYKCGPNGLCGHGYAAEDANSMSDMLGGHQVTLSGRDNSLSGPDRIVDGVRIQTKYCQTAKQSVMAGFGEDGFYKYNGQILEVPADQYPDALKEMGQKIADGKVPGFTDPKDASKIIKKGSVTYKQAKNIAKAGNIDSLIFDAKTQSVIALSAFGISFAINLGMMVLFHCRNKKELEEAVQLAFLKGLENGTISLTSGILTTQVLRTSFGRKFAASLTWMSKDVVDAVYKTSVGKELIHQIAAAIVEKNVYGGAAKNVVTKLLRTNALTTIALVVVTSIPDVWRLLSGQISGPQFAKNIVILCGGFAGCAGGAVAGAKIGASLGGGAAGPLGVVGGVLGGAAIGALTKAAADLIRKDDAELLMPILQVALLQLSHDYMIQSEEEFEHCIQAIANERVIEPSLFRKLQKCKDDFERVAVAMDAFDYYFSVIIRDRRKVALLGNQQYILDSVNKLENYIPAEEAAIEVPM